MMKLLPLVLLFVACSSAKHDVRFANAPAVRAVDDRHDTPNAPVARPFAQKLYHFRGNVLRRVNRGLDLREDERSIGVNAVDEVPDSTWFTNRRELTLDEIRTGPAVVGSPEPHLPWTIKSTKVGGASLGLIVVDARGEKFVLKFDDPRTPELETSADVVTGKLLWAVGYNVPEDHIVHFRATDLVLPETATIKDVFGNARPLRRADLDRLLARVAVESDGRIRGMASRFLDGKWLGGHPDEGVRRDDPNDRIPHQLRRELRGARAIFAWLDHVDVKEDNTLDMWVTDPATSQHYVRHYLIDFGKALGVTAKDGRDPRRSFTYQFDLGAAMSSLATLGLAPRRWDGRNVPAYRGLGMYDAATYVPAEWKPNSPSYRPFLDADDVDGFWGTKLLMRFTREQLRAAVETGRYSDPRTVEYLTDTLVERQKITARHWFSKVAPLDQFTAHGSVMCFDDLLLTYRLAAADKITTYRITTTDRAGRQLGTSQATPSVSGRACTAPLQLADAADGYTIVAIETRRHTFAATTYVHVARHQGAMRVIGLWRETAVTP